MTSPFFLVGRTLPASIERTIHVVTAGHPLSCADQDWRDVLAVVEHGTVEIRTRHGRTLHLDKGGSFCLLELEGAVLSTTGANHAVVATIRRVAGHGSRP